MLCTQGSAENQLFAEQIPCLNITITEHWEVDARLTPGQNHLWELSIQLASNDDKYDTRS